MTYAEYLAERKRQLQAVEAADRANDAKAVAEAYAAINALDATAPQNPEA